MNLIVFSDKITCSGNVGRAVGIVYWSFCKALCVVSCKFLLDRLVCWSRQGVCVLGGELAERLVVNSSL